MRRTRALLSLLALDCCFLLNAALNWDYFQQIVHCDPNIYPDQANFETALTTAWDAVAADGTFAVYMLRTTVAPTEAARQKIAGDFEIDLKEFVPPDLFFYLADKATATDLRTQKANYGVSDVEAVPGAVKLMKELREAQEQAQSSGDTQPAVSIELSPGSKANDKESAALAAGWEGAVHSNCVGSVAKFKGKAKDVITLEGVKGTDMACSLAIVAAQPEALVLELLPTFTEIDPVPPGTVQPITRRLNDDADDIIQSGVQGQKPFTAAGLLGQGEVVGIADSGLYDQSCFFNNNNDLQRNAEADPSLRSVIQYIAFADGVAGETRDHGTHVAGSVAGSCTNPNGKIYDGMAPSAKIVFFDIGLAGQPSLSVPGNLATGLFPPAKESGAAIHTNSWGSNTNRYTTSSRDVDKYSYDNEEFVILIAAGNSGPGQNTVGSPATAKNSISVGASVNLKTGSMEDMADFSSRGPTADGRLKPDVVAPGHSVTSAASEQACGIVQMSGTSMATPVTAGGTALVRQYFREGWYPSGAKTPADAFVPSGALLKATIMHSGQQMTGQGVGTFPGVAQGFGRIDLDSVLKLGGTAPERGTLYVRGTKVGTSEKAELAQGATFTNNFAMTGNGKIKATLVWMDPPSAINANTNLVNDLDLLVVCGQTTYYPNGRTNKDSLNNAEMIENNVAQGTTCAVSVTAFTLRQGNTQPYALVVTGPFTLDTSSPATTASPDTTTTAAGATTAPAAATTTLTTTTTDAPPPAAAFLKINAQTCGQACTCAAVNMKPVNDVLLCDQAAEALGLTDTYADYAGSTPRPEGCYYLNNRLWFAYNPANQGIGVTGPREPICKAGTTMYQSITSGTCAAVQMVPITDAQTCEAAAADLGLSDTTAYATDSLGTFPEGCYFKPANPPGFALFLATNQANVGNGGTTTRNQLCRKPNPFASLNVQVGASTTVVTSENPAIGTTTVAGGLGVVSGAFLQRSFSILMLSFATVLLLSVH